MTKNVCVVIDELFSQIADPTELKHQIKILARALHEANCKQSVNTFGANRHFKTNFIKDSILNQTMPQVEFQIQIIIK